MTHSTNPEFQKKALTIAALLGDGWTASEGDLTYWCVNAELSHPSGMGIRLQIADKTPDRIEVYGDYPKTAKGGYIRPDQSVSIGLSAKKTAEQIAAEIKRRFLPAYTETWQKVKATADGWNDHDAGCQKARALLSALPRVSFSKRDPDDMQGWIRTDGEVYGKLKINSAQSVEIEIRCLTPEKAARLIALLD